MFATEEPILSRLDLLDNVLRQLEEIRGRNRSSKSSCASTPSSGTLTSDGHPSSSVDFSPKSLEKHCRPIKQVMMETEVKGTLVDRLRLVEDRVLKLEEELEAEKKREEKSHEERGSRSRIKKLLKQLVKGRKKHKARSDY